MNNGGTLYENLQRLPIRQPGCIDMTYSTDLCVTVTAVLLASSWIAVVLRGYTRGFATRVLCWDDWFALAAMVLETGFLFEWTIKPD